MLPILICSVTLICCPLVLTADETKFSTQGINVTNVFSSTTSTPNLPKESQIPHNIPPDDINRIYENLNDTHGKVKNKVTRIIQKNIYLASIRIVDNYNIAGFTHRCLGLLVTPSIVSSVAYCLHDQHGNFLLKPSTYRVVIGASYLTDENSYLQVSKVLMHPGYLIENSVHNFALFKLTEPTRYVTLDLQYLRPEVLPNPEDCVVYTWFIGRNGSNVADSKMANDDGNQNQHLMFGAFDVKYVPLYECVEGLATSQSYIMSKDRCFRLTQSVKPACLFNIGAPVVCKGVVFGLLSHVSYARHAADSTQIGIFTGVSQYLDLIEGLSHSTGTALLPNYFISASLHLFLFIVT